MNVLRNSKTPLIAAMAILALGALPLARAEVVYNVSMPLDGVISNPCTGEDFVMSGSGRLIMRETITANGSHYGMHFNSEGMRGVGLTSGRMYRVMDSWNESGYIGKGQVITSGETFQIIGRGGMADFVVHTLFHLTMDANGDMTAFFNKGGTIECR